MRREGARELIPHRDLALDGGVVGEGPVPLDCEEYYAGVKLYGKVVELADKATIISCINEYKKIFTLQVKDDLFTYHEELQQQLRLVRAQVEVLGIAMTLPVDIEQNLMLIAAWHHPQYREIAEEISRKKRDFTLDELLRDLQRQHLLATHLEGSGSSEKERRTEPAVRIKAAKEANPKRCYLFQQGKCTRENCPRAREARCWQGR